MADRSIRAALDRGERVIQRGDGTLVVMCESGNPSLGLMLTPGRHGGGVIVAMPEDDSGHPLSCVSVSLGADQVEALAAFFAAHRANVA